MKSGRTRDAFLLLVGAALLAGCGGSDKFENEPRPPVPIQLTGVVTDKQVTISPKKVGAGPVILLVSNQTDAARVVTLEGEGTTDTVGPVPPLDTATLQSTLKPGTYTVKAGSKTATVKEIEPGTLTVGESRSSSSNQLLLP